MSAQVRSRDDVLTCARHMHTATLAPVLLTSAVTGDGLDLVRLFYNLLPLRQRWAERARSRPVPRAPPGAPNADAGSRRGAAESLWYDVACAG
jgi:hypothetical protein